MKRVSVGLLICAILVSLVAGFVPGFFLGVASTKAGAKFLDDVFEDEEQADTGSPKSLTREKFELQYPANWRIDVTDEDYDPDQMFSIESPGSAFVMFMLSSMESDPEFSIKCQIEQYSKLLGKPTIQSFTTYGNLQGKGAILKGKLMGIKLTVKAFACSTRGMTAIIVQQCPDEDYAAVKDGFALIEKTFVQKPAKQGKAAKEKGRGD